MISANILCDSFNIATDTRLITWELEYPRAIHAELMTYRTMSRSSASSRAIRTSTNIRQVEKAPVQPTWYEDTSGMASRKLMSLENATQAQLYYEGAVRDAVKRARMLDSIPAHRSIVNRGLEPYNWIKTVLSGTEWNQLFVQRLDINAEPWFQNLCYKMVKKLISDDTDIEIVEPGDWHIPYKSKADSVLSVETQIKVAVARCARTSYMQFDGSFSIEKDIELHDRLVNSGHWGPFEHVAVAAPDKRFYANYRGFEQYRSMFPGENLNEQPLDLIELMIKYEEACNNAGLPVGGLTPQC